MTDNASTSAASVNAKDTCRHGFNATFDGVCEIARMAFIAGHMTRDANGPCDRVTVEAQSREYVSRLRVVSSQEYADRLADASSQPGDTASDPGVSFRIDTKRPTALRDAVELLLGAEGDIPRSCRAYDALIADLRTAFNAETSHA